MLARVGRRSLPHGDRPAGCLPQADGAGRMRMLHAMRALNGIFAAGFRSVLGLSIIPPYQTYILYEVYVVPGLAAMMLLFHGLQTSLSMVYDREMGSMRTLLVSPWPRWFLLAAR